MTRKQLITKTVQVLKEKGITKPYRVPKRTFFITDDDGNTRSFSVKPADKSAIFIFDDVEAILDTMLKVVVDEIKHGEEVSIQGFGSLIAKQRAPKMVKIPKTDEWVSIPPLCTPKFSAGTELKAAARFYGSTITGMPIDEDSLPAPIYDEYESEDDWMDAFKEGDE